MPPPPRLVSILLLVFVAVAAAAAFAGTAFVVNGLFDLGNVAAIPAVAAMLSVMFIGTTLIHLREERILQRQLDHFREVALRAGPMDQGEVRFNKKLVRAIRDHITDAFDLSARLPGRTEVDAWFEHNGEDWPARQSGPSDCAKSPCRFWSSARPTGHGAGPMRTR